MTTLIVDTNQFTIIIQVILFALFIWLGKIIPSYENKKASFHFMPFSGGLFIIFSGIDFISLSLNLSNYNLPYIQAFLITTGLAITMLGTLKAFYYDSN